MPVIYAKEVIPFPFEYFDVSFDISCLRFRPEINELIMQDKTKKVFGNPKKEVYEQLAFILSLSGKSLLAIWLNELTLRNKKINLN